MGILQRIEQRATIEDPTTPLSSATALLLDAFGGTKTEAGVAVTPQRALTLPAVWSCVNIIASSIASLPLHVYERLEPRGKRRAPEHPLYRLLHDAPNDQMDSLTFFEVLTAHLLTWGNAYAEIEFNGAGTAIGLWPLLPDRTKPERKNGVKHFVVSNSGMEAITLPAWKVLHVAGLGFDGLRGYSPAAMLKQSLSVGMAAETFAAKFYGSGLNPGTVLMHPQRLSPEAQARLRAEMEAHTGLSRAQRVMVLEEGLKLEKLGIPPDDAQFLESRLFQVRDVARIYRVPRYMLADNEGGASYASVEAQGIDFVRHTLRTWLVRWERALNLQVIDEAERDSYFAEFNVDGLQRGDLPSRTASYAVLRQWGLLSYNDYAENENENPDPTPYGDMKLVPLNMVPAGMLEQIVAAQAKVADGGADDGADGGAKALEAARAERMELVLARVRRSHYGLIRDAAGRVARREVKVLRAKLAAADGDLAAFVAGAEEYYAGPMRADAARDLLAPVDAMARYLREEFCGIYGETRAEAVAVATAEAEALAERWIEQSREVLAAAVAVCASLTKPVVVDELLSQWEAARMIEVAASETELVPSALIERFKKEQ